MMKTLIIYPPDPFELTGFLLPEGMARLTAYLRKHGLHVTQESLDAKCFPLFYDMDFTIFRDKKRVINYIEGKPDSEMQSNISRLLDYSTFDKFDTICFSIVSPFQLTISMLLAKIIKQQKKVKIIFGGSIFNFINPKTVIKKGNYIDYIINGEGEKPLLNLLLYLLGDKHLDIKGISGLTYKKGVKLLQNKMVSSDINTFLSPIYEDIIEDYQKIKPFHKEKSVFPKFITNSLLRAYRSMLKRIKITCPILYKPPKIVFPCQISKGCIGECLFCSFKGGHPVNLKSPRLIVNDIKRSVDRFNAKNFFFCCNSINIDNNHLEELCTEIIKAEVSIRWESLARPEKMNLRLLKIMKKSGCTRISFGIESGSQKIIDYLKKGFKVKEAEKVIRYAKKVGITVVVSFLINTPRESSKDLDKTIEFLERNKEFIDRVIIHKFFMSYGSPLCSNKKHGMIKANKTLHAKHLKRLLEIAKKSDINLNLTNDGYKRRFASSYPFEYILNSKSPYEEDLPYS